MGVAALFFLFWVGIFVYWLGAWGDKPPYTIGFNPLVEKVAYTKIIDEKGEKYYIEILSTVDDMNIKMDLYHLYKYFSDEGLVELANGSFYFFDEKTVMDQKDVVHLVYSNDNSDRIMYYYYPTLKKLVKKYDCEFTTLTYPYQTYTNVEAGFSMDYQGPMEKSEYGRDSVEFTTSAPCLPTMNVHVGYYDNKQNYLFGYFGEFATKKEKDDFLRSERYYHGKYIETIHDLKIYKVSLGSYRAVYTIPKEKVFEITVSTPTYTFESVRPIFESFKVLE